MAINFKKFWEGLRIVPKTSSTADSKGDLEVIDSTGKLGYHNGTTVSPVVTEAHPATLTNKGVDADNNTVSNLEVDNLKAGVLNTDDTLAGATDTQIPSALAVKTFVDDSSAAVQADVDDLVTLTGVPVNSTDLGTFTGNVIGDNATIKQAFQDVEDGIETVASDLGMHILDAVDAHDASAISLIPTGNQTEIEVQAAIDLHQDEIDTLYALAGVPFFSDNLGTFTGTTIPDNTEIKPALQALETALEAGDAARVVGPASATDEAIARFDGTTGKLIQNSSVTITDAGVMSGTTQLNVDNLRLDGNTVSSQSGNLVVQSPAFTYVDVASDTILAQNKFFAAVPTNNTATGANATVTVNGKNLRLTDAGLTSIDMMVADAFGKEVTLINRTGNEITINNDTGGTAAYRIYTGTGANVTLPVNAAFSFVYDGTTQRWNLIGGTGSGTGGGTTDPDVLMVQTFDDASLSDFTYDGAQIATSDSLHGAQSIKFVHGAALPKYIAQDVVVDPKFRGVNITAAILLRSTASDGNVTLSVTDVGTGDVLTSQSLQTDSVSIASLTITNGVAVIGGFSNSDINTLQPGMAVTGTGIQAGTTISSVNTSTNSVIISQTATSTTTTSLRFSALPKTLQLGFHIPDDCPLISVQVNALAESDSPETYIDDICLRNYFLGMSNQGQTELSVEVPAITDWEPFTPTGSWVSNTTYSGKYRRVGENLEVSYQWVLSGAPTSATLTLNLPAGFTIDTNKLAGSVVDLILGRGVARDTGVNSYDLTAYYNNTTSFFVTVGVASGTYLANGSSTTQAVPFTWGSTDTGTMSISVPVQEFTSATETQTFTTVDLVPAKAVLGNTTIEVPAITDWAAYTPTFQGLGTVSNIEMEWRRVGETVEVRGKFLTGTVTASEVRVSLPNGYTSAGTSSIPSIQKAGLGVYSANTATLVPYVLIEPSVTYFTFGFNSGTTAGLTKQTGTSMFGSSQSFSFQASAPITGLSATEEITVSGTQAGTIEQEDGHYQLNGFTYRTASTATSTLYFNDGTLAANNLATVGIINDSVNGATFTILESGWYSFRFQAELGGTAGDAYLIKNSTSITAASMLAGFYENGAQFINGFTWSGPLVEGDVIRIIKSGAVSTFAADSRNHLSISFAGKLKQVNVNADQKITIPTSELRFEGASARGGTATAIVKFDTTAKVRGDAFTITNTSADGTYVTMTKAGKLTISASLVMAANTTFLITKNQQTLTSAAVASSEVLARSGNGTGAISYNSASYTGDVNVGDIIRIAAEGNPTSTFSNQFNLSFQEQNIQVSVSNTLPQFSESDTLFRAQGNAGTAVTANVTDIPFTTTTIDTAGGFASTTSYTIKEKGTYTVDVGVQFNAGAARTIGIYVNGSLYKYASSGASASNHKGSLTADFQKGDIITIRSSVAGTLSNDNNTHFLFITKIGKPNVTGVDVTPFIEIPQPLKQSSTLMQTATFNNAAITGTLTSNTNTGLYSYNSTTGLYTVLKNCTVTLSGCVIAAAAASVQTSIQVDGVDVAFGFTAAVTGATATAVYTNSLFVGQTFQFRCANGTNTSGQRISVTAEALSDQILTQSETFSSDTASLSYASSSQYTLSTLANAPVGTYITNTFTASTTATTVQTTTRPTQTDADMNTNGFLITARVYTATGAAATPPYFAIQIGKGMKGVRVEGQSTSGVPLSITPFQVSTNTQYGLLNENCYDPETGVLILDAGSCLATTITGRFFIDRTANGQTSAYIKVSASKNPALTGVNAIAPKIAIISGVNAATPVASTYVTRTLTTVNDQFGIVTSLASNQFTLPAGTYYITASASQHRTNSSSSRIRNVTDGISVASGVPAYASTTAATGFMDTCYGVFTINSAKAFEFQSIAENATNASYSIAAGTDYAQAIVSIMKLK